MRFSSGLVSAHVLLHTKEQHIGERKLTALTSRHRIRLEVTAATLRSLLGAGDERGCLPERAQGGRDTFSYPACPPCASLPPAHWRRISWVVATSAGARSMVRPSGVTKRTPPASSRTTEKPPSWTKR